MSVPFSAVRAIFGKDVLVEEGFVIEKQDSGFRVTAGSVYIEPHTVDDKLNLCFAVHVQHSALLRTGPIDSLSKAREFLAFAVERHKVLAAQNQKIQRKPRIVCSQLNDPLFDWEKIRLQHVYLAMAAHEFKLDFDVAHMSLGTEVFFHRADIKPRSTFQIKNTDKLAKELNWMGWVQYALWISEEMDILLENFRPDSSKTYQLEAYFRDFIHEARSLLLGKMLKELQTLSLDYAEILLKRNIYAKDPNHPNVLHKMNQEMVNIEKEIYKVSVELKESLKRIYEIVLKVEEEAVREKKIKEEYIPLRRMIMLYRKILQTQIEPAQTIQTTWSQQVMLRQLLNDELMVVSSVNCITGCEQTHMTFSEQVSVLELKHKFPPDRVIDMAFNWNVSNVKLNKIIQEQGYVSFRKWLQAEEVAEDQSTIHRRAPLIERLRKIYFRVLMDLCLPIQQLFGGSTEVEPNMKAATNYLNLLPSFLEMKYDDGDVEWIPYVTYDVATGEPKDLMDSGYHTFSRFRDAPRI